MDGGQSPEGPSHDGKLGIFSPTHYFMARGEGRWTGKRVSNLSCLHDETSIKIPVGFGELPGW